MAKKEKPRASTATAPVDFTIKKVLKGKKEIKATDTISAEEAKKVVKILKKNQVKPPVKGVSKKKRSTRKGKGQNLLRQKNLAKLLLEDRGKTPIGKLMIQAGYSKAYSKNPQQAKKTLSWAELMEEHFSDEELSRIEGEQLHASVIQNYVFTLSLTDEEIGAIIAKAPGAQLLKINRTSTNARAYFTTPDNISIGKSLDRIYKLKLKYPKDKSDNSVNEKIEEALDRISSILP